MSAKGDLIAGISARPFPTYDELEYDTFLHRHLIPNQPLILSAKFTNSWPSVQTWRDIMGPSGNHHLPNLNALRRYEHQIIPVADTSTRSFSEFERSERPLKGVLDLWESGDEAGKGLYVKDWHLLADLEKQGKGAAEIYIVPDVLRDDWMNPPFTEQPRHSGSGTRDSSNDDDFRFCYVGPAGTFTPLHRDVYASYSWSANIVGRKVWWLFPPDNLDAVKKDDEFVFDVRQLPGEGNGIKVLQQEGEVIFVPSGWHHQVVNVDLCISINHNFASSPTLPRLYEALSEAQHRVEESISDVKDMIQQRLGTDGNWEEEWVEEVQGLLKRDAGWSWPEYWEMVLKNIQKPPVSLLLSPPSEIRNGYVSAVIQRYKSRREWVMLPETRGTIQVIQDIISPTQ